MKKVFAIIVMLGCILGLCCLAGCANQNDDAAQETVEEVVTQIVDDESADGEENGYSQEIIIP